MAMISVNDIKRACLAALAQGDVATDEGAAVELAQFYQAPQFYIDNNRLGFYTGVDKQSGTPCFVLSLESAQQLVTKLERQLHTDLSGAVALIEAGLNHQPPKYDCLQQVNLANESQYRGATNSIPKLARQSKSQALYDEARQKLGEATELSTPLSPAALAVIANSVGRSGRGARQERPRVRMFMALDFEWWEKSSETILEVGWSMWDTATQRHRTRHWIIRENLNKANGKYISDNRMNFVFGTSERGSLESAFDALQAELDVMGISDGLTRQQKDMLEGCDIDMVIVGHAMSQDMEHTELFEIEWPVGMITFDTQKLYLAYQLEQLDAAAAAKALQELLARKAAGVKDPAGASAKPATLELVDQYNVEEESDGDEGDGDLDSDDSDYGLPGAVGSLNLSSKNKNSTRVGSPGSGSSGGRIAAVQPPKAKPVQGPVRVRPWPAGPLPSERAADKAEKGADGKQKDKIQQQISLGAMLGELKIKSARLHNAGNDARYTMEAFLAITGHPVCHDPAAAHNNALAHDPRYKQQLEASMLAAAAQGWGAPVPVQIPPKGAKQARPQSASPAYGSPSPVPSSGVRRQTPSPSPAAVGGGAWGGRLSAAVAATNGAAAGAGPTGAWGNCPSSAAAAATSGAAANGGRAWGRPNTAVRPTHAQVDYAAPTTTYEPSADGW